MSIMVQQSERKIEDQMKVMNMRIVREERRLNGLTESLAIVNRIQQDSSSDKRLQEELDNSTIKLKQFTDEYS